MGDNLKVFFWLSGSQAEDQNKESDKTVLYLLIVIIILISYIIIKLLIKRRTILADTGNGTPPKSCIGQIFNLKLGCFCYKCNEAI